MIFSKENGVKVAKGVAFIITPTIIILIILAFLWWRKKKNKKALADEIKDAASDVKPKIKENA